MLNFFTGQGIRRAQTLVTNTRVLRDEMAALYRRFGDVIYLGGFGGPLLKKPSRTATPTRILSVSRLQQSKCIDWILRSLAKHPDLPPWQLNIVGKGPEFSQLAELASSLNLGDSVIFHGFLSDAALHDLYRSSHIFAMPAIQGYGLPAIEALYQHLAVVMSSDSGVAEVLGGTQWVAISKGGEAEFAEALRNMMQRVSAPSFFDQDLPPLPTEDQWAATYAAHCGWASG